MLEKALSGSTRYRAWVGGLLLVILVGIAFYIKQFNEGLGITGMSRMSWGFYIAQFTFLVARRLGGDLVILLTYKKFGRSRSWGVRRNRRGAMCLLFVIVDLRQPMRQ
jgi:molybdopterin-containing oxidoreductase family membrane subunit